MERPYHITYFQFLKISSANWMEEIGTLHIFADGHRIETQAYGNHFHEGVDTVSLVVSGDCQNLVKFRKLLGQVILVLLGEVPSITHTSIVGWGDSSLTHVLGLQVEYHFLISRSTFVVGLSQAVGIALVEVNIQLRSIHTCFELLVPECKVLFHHVHHPIVGAVVCPGILDVDNADLVHGFDDGFAVFFPAGRPSQVAGEVNCRHI